MRLAAIAAVLGLLRVPAHAQSAPAASGSANSGPTRPGPEQNTPATVSAGPDGFTIGSADGAFRLDIGAYAQLDYRADFGDPQDLVADTFLLRRARLLFAGTVYRFLDFRLTPDFGEGKASIQDAYLDVRFAKSIVLRAGRFKPFFGLERQTSPSDLRFVERGLPSGLTPNRDLGFAFYGDTASNTVTYSLGVFNGVADGATGDVDDNDGKDLIGRVLLHPFAARTRNAVQNLSVGVAMTRGPRDGTATSTGLPSYKTTGQQVFFRYRPLLVVADGTVTRLAPQASWLHGPIGIYAEHMTTTQDVFHTGSGSAATLKVRSWHVGASVMLTGERQTFSKVIPRTAYSPSGGGWGALEIAGRVERFAVGDEAFPLFAEPDSSASQARAWGLSAIWYVTRGIKIMSSYERTSFTGGAQRSSNRRTEAALITRMQVYF